MVRQAGQVQPCELPSPNWKWTHELSSFLVSETVGAVAVMVRQAGWMQPSSVLTFHSET
jgi:hypothetical protein